MDYSRLVRLCAGAGLIVTVMIAWAGQAGFTLPDPPPLPPASGRIVHVDSVPGLVAAVNAVKSDGTILLADGRYQLDAPLVLRAGTNLMIRSASGDPTKVVLSGRGWDSRDPGDDILRIADCAHITVAGLTFTNCHSYGIKVEAEHAPRDIHITHCHFRNMGTRAIKGSASKDPSMRAVGGSVRYCLFENSRLPAKDWLFNGDYIAGIDMMALEDWVFSDNTFRNIKGRNGGGRAAIFVWVRSRNVIVERNLIVNCDRGVAFGNPGGSTANRRGEALTYVEDGIIRNNFIAGGSDCGIELWHADKIRVLHNSIWRPEQNWRRGIRVGSGTRRTEIADNLVHGDIRIEGGEAELHHNLAGGVDGYFTDAPRGDLTLTPAAKGALNKGVAHPAVAEDILRRARGDPPDLGAWEVDDMGDKNGREHNHGARR